MISLKNKTVLITGASCGLGEQFALTLSAAGARVILAARRIDKLQDLSEKLKNSRAVQVDIADKFSIEKCFAELEELGEKIDICINNAAICALTPIFEQDTSDNFESIISTNILGTWYVTKAVANHMKNHTISGSIINIGSINGSSLPYKELTAYAISKAAVIHMTKSLVLELSKENIRINTINPGPIQSHLLGSENKHNWEFWKNKIPLGFIAHPQDLNGLILYLASNELSSYVTGATFTIDGGISCGGE